MIKKSTNNKTINKLSSIKVMNQSDCSAETESSCIFTIYYFIYSISDVQVVH